MVFIRTEEKIWSGSHKDKKQGLTNAIRREDNILSNSIMTGKSILPEAMRAGGRSLTWSQNERKAFYLKPWGQEHRFSATQIPPFRHSKLQSPTRRKNQDDREIKISHKTRRCWDHVAGWRDGRADDRPRMKERKDVRERRKRGSRLLKLTYMYVYV